MRNRAAIVKASAPSGAEPNQGCAAPASSVPEPDRPRGRKSAVVGRNYAAFLTDKFWYTAVSKSR